MRSEVRFTILVVSPLFTGALAEVPTLNCLSALVALPLDLDQELYAAVLEAALQAPRGDGDNTRIAEQDIQNALHRNTTLRRNAMPCRAKALKAQPATGGLHADRW